MTQYSVIQLAWKQAFDRWEKAKYAAEIFYSDAKKQKMAETAYLEYCELCELIQYPEKLYDLDRGEFDIND